MDYLAGIDLGSTSLKCVIDDLDGNISLCLACYAEYQRLTRVMQEPWESSNKAPVCGYGS